VPFPPTFAWGVAIPSTQSEGAAPASDWRDWERQGKATYSADGNGFATNYRDDLRRLADAGVRNVRLCPEWARIEPENGRLDAWAVEHYQQVFAAAADAGLSVWVTLVDGSLPAWFSLDEKGFRDRRARSYLWPRHVERCAETFGEWAHVWVPILRPLRLARAGYLTGSAPPGLTHLPRFLDTLVGLHLGLGEAWRVLRGSAPVATGFDVAEVRSAGPEPTARARARRVDELHWQLWAGAWREGELVVPGFAPQAAPALRGAFDLVGATVEDRVTVGEDGAWATAPAPEDVGGLVHRLAEEAGDRPVVVLGQHVADADRLSNVLDELEGSVDDGVPLRGWFAEPAVDGYEGPAGFHPGRGLWDRERNPRPTVELLSERIRASAPPPPDVDLSQAVILDEP
jgi:beta-glucosidase